jgi:hypothetical protein
MLVPHRRENAELRQRRLSADQFEDALILVGLEPVFGDQFGGDFGFVAKHGLYLGGCAGFFTFRGGVFGAIHA